VNEIIRIARDVTGKEIPIKLLPRRDGDLPEFYADTTLASHIFEWKPQRSIPDSIQTAWNYMTNMQKNTVEPLVSIILPSFNPRKEWIEKAIQSVIIQTYKNFELLIIDDASSNNTFSQIQDFIRSDTRIRVIRNKKNLKLVHTLNV